MNYSLDDLRSSFAMLDYRIDNGHSVPDIVADLGVNIDALVHVAEQRGMRAALVATDEISKIAEAQATGQWTPIRLSREQQKLMAIASASEMEAIAATLLMVRKADDDTP
jgi:hypothetical protein